MRHLHLLLPFMPSCTRCCQKRHSFLEVCHCLIECSALLVHRLQGKGNLGKAPPNTQERGLARLARLSQQLYTHAWGGLCGVLEIAMWRTGAAPCFRGALVKGMHG